MEHSFYLVDVFAEGRYTGNQLAVFRNASSLADQDMQRLAREVHFSETAFVLSDGPRNGAFDIRVFTPVEEIPFSGHAVLGAAWVLQRELIQEPVRSILVNLGVGPVTVDFVYHYGGIDTVWVRQCAPRFMAALPREQVAAAIGLSVGDLDDRWPLEEVSTGLAFGMVPVISLAAMRSAHVVPQSLAQLSTSTGVRALYLFTAETYNMENQYHARMFAPHFGIQEDAATGAGAGCLAAYMLQHDESQAGSIELRIEQGYEMRRPSLLFARAARTDSEIAPSAGGRVILVAQGHFT
ncbi:MAG: PhzF family phenazine biosynthesis protein [Dehalococcoidia bacterium]|nr:PhzF family phenazine biosynthesis protein [Dehalococcoidia bacterium]